MDEEMLIYLTSKYVEGQECNFYSTPVQPRLSIFGKTVDAESVWYCKGEDKYYLHCGCKEFEGDLDILSLSDDNQRQLAYCLIANMSSCPM